MMSWVSVREFTTVQFIRNDGHLHLTAAAVCRAALKSWTQAHFHTFFFFSIFGEKVSEHVTQSQDTTLYSPHLFEAVCSSNQIISSKYHSRSVIGQRLHSIVVTS